MDHYCCFHLFIEDEWFLLFYVSFYILINVIASLHFTCTIAFFLFNISISSLFSLSFIQHVLVSCPQMLLVLCSCFLCVWKVFWWKQHGCKPGPNFLSMWDNKVNLESWVHHWIANNTPPTAADVPLWWTNLQNKEKGEGICYFFFCQSLAVCAQQKQGLETQGVRVKTWGKDNWGQ